MITGTFRFIQIALSFLLFTVILFCCEKEKRPDGILSPPEMVSTMAGLYLGEQKVSNLKLNADSSKVVFEKMRGKIFEQAGVKDSLFKKSFDYYIERPLELEQIYTALVDSLNLREQRLNISHPSDSVKKMP